MLEETAAQGRAVELLLRLSAGAGPGALDRALEAGELDWGHLLYFADINGLLGVMWAATEGLDDSRIPWRAAVRMSQWVEAQRQRRARHAEVLDALAAAGVTSAPPILLKGAAFLHTIYADDPDVRGMGDVDLLVAPGDVAPLQRWLEARGFRVRGTKNGFGAFNDHPDAGQRVVLDVHAGDPTKSGRRPEAVHALFRREAAETADARFRVPSAELSLVFACRHFCEHEEDFRKILNQDDLRLFRLVDVRRLMNLCGAARLHALADELGWITPVGRCLLYVHRLFGGAEVGESWYRPEPAEVATPVGTFAWPWPIAERVRRVDRAEWLAGQMAPHGGRSAWYTSRGGSRDAPAVEVAVEAAR